MKVAPQRRRELVDVRELRHSGRFELRAEASEAILVGYASTFEPYDMYGGPAEGGWVEQIDPGAFDRTLREKPDLHLLINHEGMPLARTKSGTLKLSVDKHGLKVEARLDRLDPDVQRLEAKMRRGDMDEMSFAFRVKAQEWSAAKGFESDEMSYRRITEVSLHKGDVSVVNWGANPTTVAELAGKRRKGANGRRRTLTLAEAQAMTLVAQKRCTPARTGTTSVAEALQQVEADDALRRARELAHGEPTLKRAYEILEASERGAVAAELARRETAEAQLRRQRDQRYAAELFFGGRPSVAMRRN